MHFRLETNIILPRQARDKHRKKLRKEMMRVFACRHDRHEAQAQEPLSDPSSRYVFQQAFRPGLFLSAVSLSLSRACPGKMFVLCINGSKRPFVTGHDGTSSRDPRADLRPCRGAEKRRVFGAILIALYMRTINLPRQARDRHRKRYRDKNDDLCRCCGPAASTPPRPSALCSARR
jgi:hypothetical protein